MEGLLHLALHGERGWVRQRDLRAVLLIPVVLRGDGVVDAGTRVDVRDACLVVVDHS
jgi:hypothetical protein